MADEEIAALRSRVAELERFMLDLHVHGTAYELTLTELLKRDPAAVQRLRLFRASLNSGEDRAMIEALNNVLPE